MILRQKQSGFTIIELLIVIVVIGILAAITIVGYNGIQERATNQQMTTAVRTYYMALQQYAIDNGTLPNYYACLGAAETYNGDPCYVGSSSYYHSAALNDALDPYIDTPPEIPIKTSSSGSVTARGIFYYAPADYIGFTMQNSTSCPSIAGAKVYGNFSLGSDMYCRIYRPGV